MAFATGNFTTKPAFRLEQSVNVIGWTTDPVNYPGQSIALVEVIVGIRRMSGTATDSGTGTLDIGTGGSGDIKSFSYNFASTDYVQIYRGTWGRLTTITDNWSANVTASTTLGTALASVGSMTYPPPTTATQPSFSPTVFNAGTAITISLPRTNATYTHDVLYSFGGLTNVSLATGVGTSYSTTPPVSLLSQIPNAAEGPYTITAITRTAAGAEVGRLSFTGTLRAPSSQAPTVTAYGISDANTAVATQVGTFVQGLSVLRLDSVTATPKQGATIADRRLSIEGQELAISGTRALLLSGSIPITARAWDSRGLSGSLAGSVTVLPYTPPVVGTVLPAAPSGSVYRSNGSGVYDPNGQNLTFKLFGDVASLINGTEKNSFTVRISTRDFDGSVWTVRNTVTPTTTTSGGRIRAAAQNIIVGGGATYLADNSYVVRVEVFDKFNSVIQDTTISTSYVTIDLNGQYVGVGKLHQRGFLDVGGEGYFRGLYSTYQYVANANTASFAGRWIVDNVSANMPAGIAAGIYQLRVDRFTSGPGVDSVIQYLSPVTDPTRVMFMRTAFASPDAPVVSYDAWTARGVGMPGHGTDAERLAISAALLYDGFRYRATDTNLDWVRAGGAWKLSGGRAIACRVKGGTNGWATALTGFAWSTTDEIDTDGMFNIANPTRITAPYAGLYRVSFSLISTGVIATRALLAKNGGTTATDGLSNASVGASGAGTAPAASGIVSLAAGDYLEVKHVSAATGAGVWNGADSSFSMDFIGQV